MNAETKGFLSGMLAGGIASAGSTVTALQEATLESVSGGSWVTIGLTGFLAAAVGWRTMLTKP